MRFGIILITVGLTVEQAKPVRAAESPSVDQLIAQLASPDFAHQSAAFRLLQAHGRRILPSLRKALNANNADAFDQIQELIGRLEIASILDPKRVTLDFDAASLEDVLKDIQRTTGYKIRVTEARLRRTNHFNVKGIPFWDTLDALERRFSIYPTLHRCDKGVLLKSIADTTRFTSTVGPYRVTLKEVSEDLNLDFMEQTWAKHSGRGQRWLTLSAAVQAEPGYLPLVYEDAVVEIALDEHGESLVSQDELSANNRSVIRKLGRRQMTGDNTAYIELKRQNEKAKYIGRLKGYFPVSVVVKRKRKLVTNDLSESAGMKFQMGDIRYEISQFGEGLDSLYISLLGPRERHSIEAYWIERVSIEDAQGNCYIPKSTGTLAWRKQEAPVTLIFSRPKNQVIGKPTKLFVEEWTMIEQQISFEFNRVPLP